VNEGPDTSFGKTSVRANKSRSHVEQASWRAIADIRIGQRHRQDMGDIGGLAASMGSVGLLHPIVVRPDGTLIDGARRLQAAQMLGWDSAPVHVVDLVKVVEGEYAANVFRKDFTPSEMVAIAAEIEPIEREAAKARQGARTDKHPGKFSGSSGNALDKVAAVAGVSRPTLTKARAIVEAAEAEPEKYGKLKDDMDRTGRANGPYKRLRNMQQAELIRAEPPPLPGRGPYRIVVVDPPWPFEHDDEDPSDRGKRPYPTMTLAEIMAVPVASISHDDAICWLWVTNFDMRQAFQVLDAWDFQLRTILTWEKDKIGHGAWLRCQTEHCIMAVRGKPIVTLTNQSTLLRAPVRTHSQKPVEFYDLVESLCPAPRYADLFSRYQHNSRWDCHGDEAPASDVGDGLAIPARLRRTAP
jgi:N6-adenosine-specific RNA methylase IME4